MNHPTAPHPENAYRILSGNVRQNVTLNEPEVALADIGAAVETYGPDIVCLQEATVAERTDPRSGYLGSVAARHALEVTFSQTRQFLLGKRAIHSGIANLVRPSLEATTTEIDLSSQRINTPLRPIGRRSLLITTFPDETRPLHVVNAHLSYPSGLNIRERRREWRKFFTIIEGLKGDVVVTGDFNLRPGSRFIKWLNQHWRPVSDQALPTWRNLRRLVPPRKQTIDYVFTNKDCSRDITVEPLPPGSSDHTWHVITIGKKSDPDN